MQTTLAVVAVLAAVASLVVGSIEIRLLRTSQRSEHLWNRKVKALEYSLAREERLRAARVAIEREFKVYGAAHPPSPELIEQKFEEDPDLRTHVLNLLGHWENLALGIYEGVVNEYVAYEMVAGTVIQHADFFQNFIRARQKENPRAYRYLLYLQRDWAEYLINPDALERMRCEAEEWLPGTRRTFRARMALRAGERRQAKRTTEHRRGPVT